MENTQCCAMGIPGIAVQPIGEDNPGSAVRFLIEWVSDGEAGARSYLAGHAEPEGAGFVAAKGHDVIGYAAIVRESDYAGFRSRGIPLIHQVAVAGPFRRQGVATLLMDPAGQLARDRGIATLGITVGLSGEYTRFSSYTGGAAMHLTAGAHARASGRCARGCWSPWTTT
jgi:GNAT superfamily N-acetyltransferase